MSLDMDPGRGTNPQVCEEAVRQGILSREMVKELKLREKDFHSRRIC